MKKIIIGIVANIQNINGVHYSLIKNKNLNYLKHKCSFVGIIPKDCNNIFYNTLDKCDGLIFQGGEDIYKYHFKILDYAIKRNIPVLGICMGCQIIGLYSIKKEKDKYLIKINNHNNTTHKITTKKNSILYKMLGEEVIVNSRHNYAIKKVSNEFKVTAVSEDKIIEGIEYTKNNHLIIGVQFHPEDLDNTRNLYNYFLKEIEKRKK